MVVQMGCCMSNELDATNTEWVVAELKSSWERGVGEGVLMMGHVFDEKRVQEKLRHVGVDVVFSDYKIDDKTFFVMRSVSK